MLRIQIRTFSNILKFSFNIYNFFSFFNYVETLIYLINLFCVLKWWIFLGKLKLDFFPYICIRIRAWIRMENFQIQSTDQYNNSYGFTSLIVHFLGYWNILKYVPVRYLLKLGIKSWFYLISWPFFLEYLPVHLEPLPSFRSGTTTLSVGQKSVDY